MKIKLASRRKGKSTDEKRYRKRMRHIAAKNKMQLSGRARLCVTKSRRHILLQLIDDESSKTLLTLHTYHENATKEEKSKRITERLLTSLREMGVEKVLFDRGGSHYSKRIAIIGDTLSKEGML
jgi:large subunit ribosomal protein L18